MKDDNEAVIRTRLAKLARFNEYQAFAKCSQKSHKKRDLGIIGFRSPKHTIFIHVESITAALRIYGSCAGRINKQRSLLGFYYICTLPPTRLRLGQLRARGH